MVVVDVANVMGARADGWWRDRAGAARRLCLEVKRARAPGRRVGRPGWPRGCWYSRGRRARRWRCSAERADELTRDWTSGGGGASRRWCALVSAPGSGDDAIVSVVADAVARDETCLVVTADRELRRRCEELNASVVGPGWLLRLL